MKYRLGTAVVIVGGKNYDEVLIGQRLVKHGNDRFCFPGGHVDSGEEVKTAAVREVLEETGIIINPLHLEELTFTTDLEATDNSGEKYITMYYVYFNYLKQEPENREPHKCKGWNWVNRNNASNFNIWDNGGKVISKLIYGYGR